MRINEATSVQPVVVASVYDMSAGRFGATLAAVLGVIGIVISGRALARASARGRTGSDAPGGAAVAIALGSIGVVVGGLIVATSDDGVGSGNGRGGAFAAIVLGLIAIVLGGLARSTARRAA